MNPNDIEAIRAAIRPTTRLVFGETLGNPGLDVLDIPRVAAVAHDAGLPVLVDATFTTPYLSKPFELGADLIVHSATKFLSGHGVTVYFLLRLGGGWLICNFMRVGWLSLPFGTRYIFTS